MINIMTREYKDFLYFFIPFFVLFFSDIFRDHSLSADSCNKLL